MASLNEYDEIACLQRGDLTETLGLTLAEAKDLLASVQQTMVKHQTEEYIGQQRNCPRCGKVRTQKGQHEIVFRSLFGKLKLHSPRLYNCSCQPQSQRSFSPLVTANLIVFPLNHCIYWIFSKKT